VECALVLFKGYHNISVYQAAGFSAEMKKAVPS
jgi:hypothetical protein